MVELQAVEEVREAAEEEELQLMEVEGELEVQVEEEVVALRR